MLGREWPLNCMTIKHDIPKIEWAIELLYNSVITGSQMSWRSDELETRCGRENHHPAEGALGVTRCGRESQHSAESWAPGSPVEHQENEKDTTLMVIRVGVNILQSLFSLQLPLTRKPYNKVRGIFFKEVFARLYSLCHYDSAAYVYVLYVCIVNHGHGYYMAIQHLLGFHLF